MPASQAVHMESPADTIEELAPDRNRPKIRYQHYTFRNVSSNGARFRWRCTVAKCRSRLETDKYGDRHLKYSFKPHDKEAHLEATAGKRRRSQMYQRKVIEGFTYVLENTLVEQNQACWRCEIVGCPGRCRTTYDFLLVAGPSQHSCREPQVATSLDPSASASQTTTSSTAGELCRQLAGQKVRTDIVEGTRGASGEAIAPKQESDCDDVYYPQVILNERSSPLLSAAATGVDAGAVGDGDFSRTPPAPLESQLHARHGHSRKLVWSDGEQDPEAGPSHVSGDSWAVPAAPESKGARKDDSTVVEPEVIELVDTNDEDICEEEQASMSTGCDDRSDDESDGQDPSSERERLEIELLQADLRIEVLKRKLIERKLQSPVLKKSRASQVDHSTHVDE